MFNFILKDSDAIRKQVLGVGIWAGEKAEASEFGRFGGTMDPKGNRVGL